MNYKETKIRVGQQVLGLKRKERNGHKEEGSQATPEHMDQNTYSLDGRKRFSCVSLREKHTVEILSQIALKLWEHRPLVSAVWPWGLARGCN